MAALRTTSRIESDSTGAYTYVSKEPKNLTLDTRVLAFADAIMEKRGFSSLTELVQDLIRTEYEKRFGGGTELKEPTAPAYQVSSVSRAEQADNDRKMLEHLKSLASKPRRRAPGKSSKAT